VDGLDADERANLRIDKFTAQEIEVSRTTDVRDFKAPCLSLITKKLD